MEISLVPAVPEGSLAALISLSYWISFTFVQMDAISCQKSKTSSSCWVLPFFYSISPGFLYPRVIEYTLYQSSKYHSINFCLSSVFSSLLQVKHKSFCDPSWSLFFFFYVSHCNRDFQEHLLYWCALVPLWCPEMWPEIWLLDIRGLVSGLTDVGGRYHQLHRQRRVGSRR